MRLVEGDAAFPTSLAALTSAFAAGFMPTNQNRGKEQALIKCSVLIPTNSFAMAGTEEVCEGGGSAQVICK